MAIEDAITLKKLEVFLAFMTLNNMARVSEMLGQSVVSVHRALHSLEDEIGCPLFKREGRNLIPLPAAYTFADYAKRSVYECEEGVRKVRESTGFSASRLKIGSIYSLTLRCIPQLLIKLKLRKPSLDIDLTMGSNRDLLAGLAEGQLDAIIIGLGEENSSSKMVSVPLFTDEFFLAAPLDSPYAGRKSIALQDVSQEKFISLTDGFATTDDFYHCFERAGITPNVALRVKDIFSLINLVSGGIGYSLLPGRIGEFSPRIELIPLSEKYAMRQSITLLILSNRERDPNLLALAAECRLYGRAHEKSAGNIVIE